MPFAKLTVCATAAAALTAGTAHARDNVQIAGSSTVLPYASIVAELFGENFDYPTPVIESGGSSAGLKRFCEGVGDNTIDIANASRRIKISEVEKCSAAGITIVEIKSSIADLKADNKWPDYREYCDALFFATLSDVPPDIFPEDAGFIVADAHGAEIMRPAPEEKLIAVRRKAVHLAFARASAQRLARCCAHAGVDSTLFNED